jgi:hypothetical protein
VDLARNRIGLSMKSRPELNAQRGPASGPAQKKPAGDFRKAANLPFGTGALASAFDKALKK